MDLRDEDGLLNKGRVWLQADDIDVKTVAGTLDAGQYRPEKRPLQPRRLDDH